MKHRILQIVSDLAHGGTQRQMALVAAGLPPAEFDVQVIALGESGPLAAELSRSNVSVAALGQRGAIALGPWWKLRRALADFRPHLVHLWHGDKVGALAGLVTTSLATARMVITRRDAELGAGFAEGFLERRLAGRAEFVVASCRTVEHALGQQGWPTQEQMLIWDGVPTTAAPTKSRQELLRELQLPEQARYLITVGPLTQDKRIKDLIWATDMLKFFREDVHLLVVGEGPHRARLEKFRAQCEIEDRVHFLGDRSDVPQLLSCCDVFCSSCGAKGPSVAILEAMMAGVPVVAVDVPVNRELVALGETGFLVPLGDRNQFARCAHKLTTDEALRQRMSDASRRRAIEHFSAEQMVGRYVGLYRQLLAAKLTP